MTFRERNELVGIVLVSHSFELAHGLAALASQVAGAEVRIEPAGGGPDGSLGTTDDTVVAAIARADVGQGVVVLADLGSSVLTVRHLLENGNSNGHIRLVDAPFVEGAIAAAVMSSAGQELDDVARAAEEARDARKL
ncbi:MAG: phosphoenolpyruvate--protein phosphotransferase [Chloroflexi bacterium]|nr:MAG: phosphoenolpyruvate--protein phosphotransferase [Chloroflexota bacterium]